MADDIKNCPECDTEVNVSAKFCMNCGHKFSTQEIKPEVVEQPKEETNINEKDSFDISQYFVLYENMGKTVDNTVNAIKENDWQNALTFIDHSLEEYFSNVDLWALKSYILFKLEYFDDTITSADISLNLNDFSQLAWASKAFALDKMGENLAAIYCCNEFLMLNPTNGSIIQLKIDLNDKISSNVSNSVQSEESELTSSVINDSANPWDTKSLEVKINPWQSSETKLNSPEDLEINPNDNYNFTGEFANHFTNFKDIFTPENHRKLEYNRLAPVQYKNILNKIKSTSDDILNKTIKKNNIDFKSLDIFEKVLLFTKSFVDVEYKAGGADLGNYAFNKINLDDRLDTANQITTLIHELAHHLLAEIFEQSAMIIFNTDKTDALESFVGFSLMCNNSSILLNEYCAHTVEGRFTPHGYQNYGSFENILQRFDIERDRQVIFSCMTVGNTFCKDLLGIIEPFIDKNLREEIKQQFKKDFNYPPNYKGISLEIRDTIDVKELLDFINFILLTGFNKALENPDRLFEFKKNFELNNKGGI